MILHLIVAAGLLGTYQTVMSLQLAGEQQAQKNVGAVDYSLEVGVDPSTVDDLRALESAMKSAVESAGGSVESVTQTAFLLDLDGSVRTGNAVLMEGDWIQNPFPERFTVTAGRWPTTPDEIAVQQELAGAYSVGDTLTLSSGAIEFTVVGIVSDDYQRSADSLFAAADAWERILSLQATTSERFSRDSAVTVLRWNGGNPDTVIDSLGTTVADSLQLPLDAARTQLGQSLLVRSELANRKAGGLESTSALTGTVPLTLIPALAALIGSVLVSRFAKRARNSMWRVGLPWSTTAGACLIALIAAVVSGSVAGCLLGLGGSALVRPLVGSLSSQPLSPFANPLVPATLLIAFAILGVVVGSILTGVTRPVRSSSREPAMGARVSSRRRRIADISTIGFIAVLCVVLVLWVLATVRNIASTNAMSTAVIMLAVACAGALALIVRGLIGFPHQNVVGSLAMRRFGRTPSLIMLVAGGLSLSLSIPVAVAVTAATQVTFTNQSIVAAVPAGQVELGRAVSSGNGLPSELRPEFEAATGLQDPVVLRTALASSPDLNGLLTVVPTADDLSRILQRPLTNSEESAWRHGAILSLSAESTNATVPVETVSKPGVLVDYPIHPLTKVPEEYRYASGGFISTQTAKNHDLPLQAGYFVYTGVSQEQLTAARNAPTSVNFDASWLNTHIEPEKFTVPANWLITSAVLGLIVSLISIVVARSQAKSLRPYVSGLNAVGVPLGLLRRTVSLQMLTVIGMPCLGGVIAGCAAAAAVWAIAPTPTTVTLPWSFLIVMLAGGAAALVLGIATGVVKLHARERLTN